MLPHRYVAVKLISDMCFTINSSFALFLLAGNTNGIRSFFLGRLMQAATSNV
jgi:hypothetical protein